MPEYNIELISIGDEILLGHTIDSNANYIQNELVKIGHQLRWHTTIGDNSTDMFEVFDRACNRSQAIIVTGGLGLTHDDITRPVLTDFFRDKLEVRDDLRQTIYERFASRGMAPPPGSDTMSEFPTRAMSISNEHGSAPGIHFQEKGINLFALPGVPTEMADMVTNYVIKCIQEKGQSVYRYHLFRTSGIGESRLSDMIGDSDLYFPIKMAFLPSIDHGVSVRLSHRGSDAVSVESKLDEKVKLVRNIIKKYVYSEDERNLEEIILDQLRAINQKLAIAESCTGGMICERFVSIPGSSKSFDRGFITYSDQAKSEQLGVSKDTLEHYGAVSKKTALEMAMGAMQNSEADIGLSITGIAGPDGGSEDKPVGLTYIGLCDKNSCYARNLHFANGRNTNRRLATMNALTLLWKHLKSD